MIDLRNKRQWASLVFLICIACLQSVFAQREERAFKIAGTASVSVKNISGNIEVTTWNRPEVKVEAVKTGEGVMVEMEQLGDSVRISTKYPERSGRHGSVNYLLSMPTVGNLEAASISGDISVMNLSGEIRVETISGDLRLSQLGKRLKARTVSGDVVMAQGQVDVDLNSVSGDIDLKEVAGSLEIGTVSGSLRILRCQASRVQLSSTSGDVELETPLLKGGNYRVNSHSGEVTLYLSQSASFEILARTFSGNLESGLPLNMTTPEATRRHGRTWRGTYGTGEAIVDVQTFSGDVRIISR